MGDLHATYFDAQHMYDFLANVIAMRLSDITIMSTEQDYFRLFSKPSYQGDFLTQMFDWNLNQEHCEFEAAQLSNEIIGMPVPEEESWESFSDGLDQVKYKVKHTARQWKKEAVRAKIEQFKTESFKSEAEKSDKLPVEFKIKCEDFWKKRDDPRRDQLFRKMHPLIFLKEQLPSYIKIQNNWVFQFLTETEKKDYLQQRKPQYVYPKKENYDEYIDSIKTYSDAHPDEEILSI